MSRRKKQKNSSPEHISRLLRKPWLFAGAVFGLDLAMLIIGMVLSRVSGEGIAYTVSGDSIVRDDPLSFFGVIAAVVLGINCVLVGLLLASAFTRNRNRGAVLIGGVGLLLISLAMIGCSAFVALGSPIQSRKCYSYTDETFRLIAEETKPYFGGGSVSFFLADCEKDGKAVLLASTDINEFAANDERYSIEWHSETLLQIGFTDGLRYRTVSMNVDRSLIEE